MPVASSLLKITPKSSVLPPVPQKTARDLAVAGLSPAGPAAGPASGSVVPRPPAPTPAAPPTPPPAPVAVKSAPVAAPAPMTEAQRTAITPPRAPVAAGAPPPVKFDPRSVAIGNLDVGGLKGDLAPTATDPRSLAIDKLDVAGSKDDVKSGFTRVNPVTGAANGTGQGIGGGIHVNGPGDHYNDDGTPKYQDDVTVPTVPRAPPPVVPPPPPIDDHTKVDPHMPPPGTLGPAKDLPPPDDNGVAELARERVKERAALDSELSASNARELLQTASTTGLGGMGLSGAAANLHADIANKGIRNKTLAMSQLGRSQRDEQLAADRNKRDEARYNEDADWRKIQRNIAIDQLEEIEGKDIDHDGDIAGQSEDDRNAVNNAGGAVGDASHGAVEVAPNQTMSGVFDAKYGPTPPPDANTYAETTNTIVGWPTGQDANYVYTVGVDGKKWKIRKKGR